VIKRLLKRGLRILGWQVSRYGPVSSPEAQLASLLRWKGIDVVLDVGANAGQFARSLRDIGYAGWIVSFEPLSQAHRALRLARGNDRRWIVAPRMALGNRSGQVTLNVARNSVSSSVLEMLPAHLKGAPDSGYVGQEEVRLATLDSVWQELMPCESRSVFLKLDVQGYEREVLDGAADSLASIRGLQVELSLLPLYAGQTLYLELIERLGRLGFGLCALANGFVDASTGRTLQIDGVFFR
jgi:FkbM family methyltransferase